MKYSCSYLGFTIEAELRNQILLIKNWPKDASMPESWYEAEYPWHIETEFCDVRAKIRSLNIVFEKYVDSFMQDR